MHKNAHFIKKFFLYKISLNKKFQAKILVFLELSTARFETTISSSPLPLSFTFSQPRINLIFIYYHLTIKITIRD